MHDNNYITADEVSYCRSRRRGYVYPNTLTIHAGKGCKGCPNIDGCDVVARAVYLRYGDLYFPPMRRVGF
jgi:hypothetical protein